jgi:hypothetical protein
MPEIRLGRLPEQARAGLKKLLEQKQDIIEDLAAALEGEPPELTSALVSERVARKVKDLAAEDVQSIIRALLTIATGRLAVQQPVAEFAQSLVDQERATIEERDRSRAVAVLQRLLSARAIAGTSKATDVITDHSQIFLSARMLTDLRPVFGEAPSSQPIAAALVHTLKITYAKDRDTLEFFVAMDEQDIQRLREVLERENIKTKALRSVITTSGWHDLDEASTKR